MCWDNCLLVTYAGLSLLSAKCDGEECSKSQVPRISLEYWFPLGFFWSQIVRLQIDYQANVGPRMSLCILRRIPDSAQGVNFALNGNIDGLKDLFIRGLASLWDVSSTRDYSLLRVSCIARCILPQMLKALSELCMKNNTTLAIFWWMHVRILIIGKRLLWPIKIV